MVKDMSYSMVVDMRAVSLKVVDMDRVDWLMRMETFMMEILSKAFQRVRACN